MALGFRGFNRGASSVPKSLVTYNVDTGTSYQEKVKKGDTVLSPTSFTPAKTGYTFLGWREDTLPNSNVLVTKTATGKPMTLYAVFYKVITLSYNGNGSDGGSTASQTGNRYWNNSYVSDPTFTVSANGYTKTDYIFIQWHKDSTSGTAYAAGASLTIGQDTTMYAEWLVSTVTFDYTGAMQVFNALAGVTYRLQIYGAQGGTANQGAGGSGGYTEGYRTPSEDETWYVGVGGAGGVSAGWIAGGYNGGGYGFGGYGDTAAGGGGASHVGYTNGTLANTPVANLIAAAGGGGGSKSNWNGAPQYGGSGGGSAGGNGTKDTGVENNSYPGQGGTQTAAGYGQYNPTKAKGGYGYGGNALSDHDAQGEPSAYGYVACGGGGGYYGGGGGIAARYPARATGGGGSGYTGGLTSATMSNGQKTGNGQVIISIYSM